MRLTCQVPGLGMSLVLDYHRIYTGAFVPASLAPVTSLTGDRDLPEGTSWTVQVPAIRYVARRMGGTGSDRWRPPPPDAGSWTQLLAMTGRQEIEIEVRVGDTLVAALPMLLLEPWQWPHDAAARVVAAAYALPGDRVAARLVSDAGLFTDAHRLDLDAPGSFPAQVSRLAAELYRHLAREYVIRYERPRIDVEAHSGATHQRVRSPQDLLAHPGDRRGEGNCLDLSLLFAGCFESLGLQPVLCFVGAPADAPVHVFPGVWAARSRRFRPLLTDREAIANAVETGDLILFEATGVCPGSTSLGWEDGAALARARVRSGEALHLVDVAAARPPAGHVRPLELPNDAAVQRALWRAQSAARAAGSRHLETLHVLYGLCGPEAGLTRLVLVQAGSSPERVQGVIEGVRAEPGDGRFPVPTQNFELCWTAARGYARSAGRSRIEEFDLLWAVLENPSRNVKRILTAAGCDVLGILRELERRGGRPGLASMSLLVPEGDGSGPPLG